MEKFSPEVGQIVFDGIVEANIMKKSETCTGVFEFIRSCRSSSFLKEYFHYLIVFGDLNDVSYCLIMYSYIMRKNIMHSFLKNSTSMKN